MNGLSRFSTALSSRGVSREVSMLFSTRLPDARWLRWICRCRCRKSRIESVSSQRKHFWARRGPRSSTRRYRRYSTPRTTARRARSLVGSPARRSANRHGICCLRCGPGEQRSSTTIASSRFIPNVRSERWGRRRISRRRRPDAVQVNEWRHCRPGSTHTPLPWVSPNYRQAPRSTTHWTRLQPHGRRGGTAGESIGFSEMRPDRIASSTDLASSRLPLAAEAPVTTVRLNRTEDPRYEIS